MGGPHAPYTQSERLPIYHKHSEELIAKGLAYRCFCTPERLTKLREGQSKRGVHPAYDRACLQLPPDEVASRYGAGEKFTVRLKVQDRTGHSTVDDAVRGSVRFPHNQVQIVQTDPIVDRLVSRQISQSTERPVL